MAWGAHANLLPFRFDLLVFYLFFSFSFVIFFPKAVKLGLPPKKCLFKVLRLTLEGFYEREAFGRPMVAFPSSVSPIM